MQLRCRAGEGGRGGVTGEPGADGRGCGRGDACDAREGQALVVVLVDSTGGLRQFLVG